MSPATNTIEIRAIRVVVVALAVSILVSACSTEVAGNPRASSPPPLLEQNQIEALLPTAEQTAQVVDGPHIEIGAALRAIKAFPFPISDPNCFASISEATEPAYRDSGYGPVRGFILTEPGGNLHAREHLVGEAVVLYHTPQQADALVSHIVEQWSTCANKTLTEYPPGMAPQNWPLGSPNADDDVHTLFNSQEAAGGWGCSRAITSRRNVVIDVRVCSKAGEAALNNQAATLVHTIAAKIPF
ncbi:sensor domain-containing protein [Mycobacterium heidelbergense]|uniref:sensor domain-containing protein n=1 Tax=Mycobacterium heidelbergense TaxID=53376 RepID=UPI003CEA57D7